MSEVFVIVSAKHTQPRDKYITFWRPARKGYCWPLSWAGHYDANDAAQIAEGGLGQTFSVPLNVALAMSEAPARGQVDGDAGPVVPKTKANMQALRAATVHS
jgi:hypothetical protein